MFPVLLRISKYQKLSFNLVQERLSKYGADGRRLSWILKDLSYSLNEAEADVSFEIQKICTNIVLMFNIKLPHKHDFETKYNYTNHKQLLFYCTNHNEYQAG